MQGLRPLFLLRLRLAPKQASASRSRRRTAFVPQACITARKTLKTGWRNPYVLQKLTNFQTYELSNLQTYKTYFRIVSAEGSGPPGKEASLSMIFYYHLLIGEVWTIRNETTYPIHGKYPLNQVRNLQLVLTDARLLVLTRVRLLVFAGQSYNLFSFCSNINWKKKKARSPILQDFG